LNGYILKYNLLYGMMPVAIIPFFR